MKKFINKKTICCFTFGVIGAYILVVIISAVMMSKMTRITYNAIAYGTTIKTIVVDFAENTAQKTTSDFYGKQMTNQKNSIKALEEIHIKAMCSLALLPLWRKTYDNPWVVCGDHYNIIRSYGNNESPVYGSNAYPLTYWLIMRTINGAVE